CLRARNPARTIKGKRLRTNGGLTAASPKARGRIGREIRGWALHPRTDKSLKELAAMYNPTIRGWIAYSSHFYRTQLSPTLRRIDAYVIRWARRKYKRMVHQTRERGIGSTGYAGRHQNSLLTGLYAMATAEHREP